MGAKKSRKSPRAQVSLVARYRSPTAFEFVREECFDLSIGGMFIKSPAPAPAGTLLKLECDVDEGAARIRGVARVVWLREQSVDGHPAGMGVKFVKLEPGGRDVIAGILDRLGTELDEEGEQRRSQAPAAAAPGPFQRTPSARPDLLAGATTEPTPSRPPSKPARAETEVTHPAGPSDAITVRPPSEPVPGAGAAVQPLAAQARSSPAAAVASSDQHARDLRDRLQQAKRQSSSPAAAPAAKPAAAVATPAPRAAARDAPDASAEHAPRSRRPLLYAAILLLAASGVYALTRGPGGEPAPTPAPEPTVAQAPEPAPAPVPPPALPPAVVAPPAQDTVPTSIAPAAPRYVLEVVTQPAGARVTAGAQTLVAPGELDLGALDDEVVVTAQLDGHLPAQASVDRVGFMLDEGAMRRRMVLKLNAAPQPRPKPEPEPSARKSRRERSAERAEREPRAERAPKPAAAPTQAPEPPPPALPPVIAVVPTAPAPAAAVVPAPAPAPPAAPKPKAEPEPEEKPADTAPKQRPIDAAMACLGTGDNACVVKALEGKAKSAQELELLIETYRAMGNAAKAEKHMEIYVDKHPGERRASAYRRLLEHQQAEGAAPPP